MNDSETVGRAKKQATLLIARLSQLGVSIKHTHGLEAVAAVHDFPDWNTFQAASTSATVPDRREKLVRQPEMPRLSLRRHQIVVAAPGEGKTATLALLMAEAIDRQPGIPLWIDFGGGNASINLPEFLRSQVTRVAVHCDSDGCVTEAIAPHEAKAIVLDVIIHPRSTGITPGDATGAFPSTEVKAKALRSLATVVRTTWPRRLTTKISLVVIDEITAIDKTIEVPLCDAMTCLHGLSSNVRLVFGTQFLAPSSALLSMGCEAWFSERSTHMSLSAFTEWRDQGLGHLVGEAPSPEELEAPEWGLVSHAVCIVLLSIRGRQGQEDLNAKNYASGSRGDLFMRVIESWRRERRVRIVVAEEVDPFSALESACRRGAGVIELVCDAVDQGLLLDAVQRARAAGHRVSLIGA